MQFGNCAATVMCALGFALARSVRYSLLKSSAQKHIRQGNGGICSERKGIHMRRAAIVKISVLSAVIIAALGFGGWAYVANSPSHKVIAVTNAQHQLTQLSYRGHSGQNALALLKKHADVQTKHYSFGDLVTTINGIKGAGPKYWTFYVNGKMAQVGAGSYTTKSTDTLMWKLQ